MHKAQINENGGEAWVIKLTPVPVRYFILSTLNK